MKFIKIAAVIFSVTFFFAAALHAEEKGKLDKFEQKLEEKESEKVKLDKRGSQESSFSGASEGLFNTMFTMLLAGLAENLDKEEIKYIYKDLRKNGIPALPIFRVEGAYQYDMDEIHGFSGQAEVGYLMFGVDGEYLNYQEPSPDDELSFISGHFLLRAYLMEHFQVNLALGGKTIHGDAKHDGFELGFPFYVFFGKHFIWDIKPYLALVEGRDVYDFSSGLSYKYKWLGVRAAYRAISVNDLTIHGPRIGLFVQF